MIRITGMISASGKIGVHAFGRSMYVRLRHEFLTRYNALYCHRECIVNGIYDAVLLTRATNGPTRVLT